MTIADLARPEIRRLKPYEAAQQVADTVRLNANEAPWTSAADRFRRPLNRYPEIRPAKLRDALARHYDCAPERLLVTRGTSEAIDLLMRVFCRAGVDNIVTPAPTFSMYRHYAEVQGAEVREVQTSPENGFAVDIDAVLAACDEQTRLVIICSPNNPTGTLVPLDRIRELLQRRGSASAVVIDEAYIEFAGSPSALSLLDEFDNLIVLRTLSKALAFAGARCGSVIGPEAVIDMLNAVQAPYAMSTPVIECVEDALTGANLRQAEAATGAIVDERERLAAWLVDLPYVREVWPSAANFLLVQVDDADALLAHSNDAGILLRHFRGDLGHCLRISVGSRADNDRLMQSLQAFTGSASR